MIEANMNPLPPPQPQPTTVIAISPKSVGISILLTVLLGPLGMLYSTVPGAIIMVVVSCVVGFVTFGLGLFVMWPVCVIWGAMSVNSYNRQLQVAPSATMPQ